MPYTSCAETDSSLYSLSSSIPLSLTTYYIPSPPFSTFLISFTFPLHAPSLPHYASIPSYLFLPLLNSLHPSHITLWLPSFPPFFTISLTTPSLAFSLCSLSFRPSFASLHALSPFPSFPLSFFTVLHFLNMLVSVPFPRLVVTALLKLLQKVTVTFPERR